MTKKIINLTFIVLFLLVLVLPMAFAEFSSGEVSENENRYLADLPKLFVDGKFNEKISNDTEAWFMDHMGFRQELVKSNAALQYHVFDSMLNETDYRLGAQSTINYATDAIIRDYAHINRYPQETLEQIARSYQQVSDYLESKDIQFYYVQCYDKQSIYPEEFLDTVYQYGEVSRTDDIMAALKNTTVNVVDLKQPMLEAKKTYQVNSQWGDPTHWTQRGAFIGYQCIMEKLNENNENAYRVLQEQDFDISVTDQAISLSWYQYQTDMQENFVLREPQAEKRPAEVLGYWAGDERHCSWHNPSVNNGKTLLLMCDSYIASFNAHYYAESFETVILIRADHTKQLTKICSQFKPDVVIYEAAERVDRSVLMMMLAETLETQ